MGSKELEVLLFFGAIHRLEDKISFGHNRAYYNEICLGDLETVLLNILKALNHGTNPIKYQTTVSSIDKDNDNEAVCTLFNSETKTLTSIKPLKVIVADGFSGHTKNLLGIIRVGLAKTTLVHFSIFEKYIPRMNRFFATLAYRIKSFFKAFLFGLKLVGLFVWYRKSFEATYAIAIDGGPTGLSRIPSHDYLLRVLQIRRRSSSIEIFKINWT